MSTNNFHRYSFYNGDKWAPLWSLLFIVGFDSWVLAMFNKHWETGFIWIGLGGIVAFLCQVFHAHQSAKLYYWWLSAIQFIISLSLLDLACQFALTGIADNKAEYICVMIVSWLTFLMLGVLDVRNKIRDGRKYLIQSGALNLKTAEWDSSVGIQLENPQQIKKKMSKLRKLQLLSPLMPPLAFYISRNFSNQVEHLVISVVFYFVLVVSSYEFGTKLMMCYALPQWEKEIGKPITVKPVKN